jgi:5-formyltetrahydrofolate cyclo-ligase
MSEVTLFNRKADMRERVRLKRQQISLESRQGMNSIINHALPGIVNELGANRLSAFWTFDGEPDLRPSLKQLNGANCDIALPVISKTGKEMTMHCWQPGCEMKHNRFGIAEPQNEAEVEAGSLDLMLIPLVAWDKQGRRLGMGAGYYDRILAPLKGSKHPYLLGVAFGVQMVEEVPVDDFDVPLDGMISENGWTQFIA